MRVEKRRRHHFWHERPLLELNSFSCSFVSHSDYKKLFVDRFALFLFLLSFIRRWLNLLVLVWLYFKLFHRNYMLDVLVSMLWSILGLPCIVWLQYLVLSSEVLPKSRAERELVADVHGLLILCDVLTSIHEVFFQWYYTLLDHLNLVWLHRGDRRADRAKASCLS